MTAAPWSRAPGWLLGYVTNVKNVMTGTFDGVISPVRSLKVGNRDAQTAATDVGTTPVVSWAAPIVGKPVRYDVRLGEAPVARPVQVVREPRALDAGAMGFIPKSSNSAILIGALRHEPALIQVIIQEISRSDRIGLAGKVDAFEEAFKIVRSIIHEGQKKGELSKDLDAQVGTYLFFGALETVCTGFMLKKFTVKNEAEAEALKKSVRRALLDGMRERP